MGRIRPIVALAQLQFEFPHDNEIICSQNAFLHSNTIHKCAVGTAKILNEKILFMPHNSCMVPRYCLTLKCDLAGLIPSDNDRLPKADRPDRVLFPCLEAIQRRPLLTFLCMRVNGKREACNHYRDHASINI